MNKGQAQSQDYYPASRDQIRALKNLVTRGENDYKIEYDLIHPDVSFNVRTDYGNLDELANSISESGLIQPLIGDFVVNDKGKLHFVLTDGYRRYKAIGLLRERGEEYSMVNCRINEKGISLEDRYFKMFITQDSKHLTDLEVSAIFRKLVNAGIKTKDIALRVGKTETYVKDLLEFSKQTESVKQAVEKGQTTVTAVNIVSKKFGADKTKAIVEKSISENKKLSVKEAQKVVNTSTPSQEKITYERKYVLATTLKGLEIQRDELLDLESRDKEQVSFLNTVITAIDKFHVQAKEEVSLPAAIEFKEGISFDTILYTEYCSTFCDIIGMENSIATYKWWQNKLNNN